MSNPYTAESVSGYNATPPADDGSQVASNQVTWAKHKDKLADPIKTAYDTSETNTETAFNGLDLNLSRAISSNDTMVAADERKLISATNTITYTLLAAATAADGFPVTVLNAGSGIVTLDGNASELVGGATTLALSPGDVVKIRCDGTGWDVISRDTATLTLRDGSELTIATGSITPTASYHTVDTESDAASDALTDIVTTNFQDGAVLVIRAENGARDVVVTHTASGANKIVLTGATDITLDDVVKSVTLQRRGDHWEELASATGGTTGALIDVEFFTTSGTWNRPSGTTVAEVRLQGGGGGGGGADLAGAGISAGGGGGQGEYRTMRVSSPGATETVTIGAAGGGGGAGGTAGTAGGTTSFGTHVSGAGGSAGSGTGTNAATGTIAIGGAGGSGGTGGDFTRFGQAGTVGSVSSLTGQAIGGTGGGQGGGLGPLNGQGSNGNNGGGGGGGATHSGTGNAGGNGGPGWMEVRSYR